MLPHILTSSLASTALAFALTALSFSFSFPLTASLDIAQPPSLAPFAVPWRLFA